MLKFQKSKLRRVNQPGWKLSIDNQGVGVRVIDLQPCLQGIQLVSIDDNPAVSCYCGSNWYIGFPRAGRSDFPRSYHLLSQGCLRDITHQVKISNLFGLQNSVNSNQGI